MPSATAERAIPSARTVHRYAEDVVSGRVLAGSYVRKAAERHLRDLQDGKDRGIVFDEKRATRALAIISHFNLEAGVPFDVQPFQAFQIGSLLGWMREDGHRRFRVGYIEEGKGNGKTPTIGALGIYGARADGQTRAEILFASTTRAIARIPFDDSKAMIAATPELANSFRVLMHHVMFGGNVIKPVSSEGRSLSGPRVHMGLVDELHEHPSDVVVEKLRAGTKRNLDALIAAITNSGASRTSVCWEYHQYSINVVDQVFDDDSWFGYVCSLDPCDSCRAEGKQQPTDGCPDCDDWRDEDVWVKANPGIDTILPRVYIREQVREAKNRPAKQNLVKRLNFCIWTEQIDRWIDMVLWDASSGKVTREALRGEPCYGGLTMVSRRDFAAFVLWFPGPRVAIPFFWIPEAMEARTRTDREVIEAWSERGLVVRTPGNITDFDTIREAVLELSEEFAIEEIAYNPSNATQVATELQTAGLTVVPLQQASGHMSEAAKDLEARIAAKTIAHGGHPVLRWMASNVAVQVNKQQDVRLDREHSGDTIEGIAALVMAIARAGVHIEEPPPRPAFLYVSGEDTDE